MVFLLACWPPLPESGASPGGGDDAMSSGSGSGLQHVAGGGGNAPSEVPDWERLPAERGPVRLTGSRVRGAGREGRRWAGREAPGAAGVGAAVGEHLGERGGERRTGSGDPVLKGREAASWLTTRERGTSPGQRHVGGGGIPGNSSRDPGGGQTCGACPALGDPRTVAGWSLSHTPDHLPPGCQTGRAGAPSDLPVCGQVPVTFVNLSA